MVEEIKTSNAEKCGGQSTGAGGLVQKRKEQTRPSGSGGLVSGTRKRNLELVLLGRPGM